MINEVVHIGLTVSNIDRSIAFYRDILGLKFKGEIMMKGPETDALFQMQNVQARVAYLNGSDNIISPDIELIQFIDHDAFKDTANLNKTSISEICFRVKDIDKVYERLVDNSVECLSKPQIFDFTPFGFSKSKAIYFKDPDGIILELMEYL